MGVNPPKQRRHWRYDPDRDPALRRPLPPRHSSRIYDAEVLEVRALLQSSGVPDELDAALALRPGPRLQVSAEAVMVGLVLAARHGRATNLDDVSELLHRDLTPGSRALLGLPRASLCGADSCATRAAYARVQRTFNAITTLLDPERHDRRRRLQKSEVEAVRAAWDARPELVTRINDLATRLVHMSIAQAERVGALRGWRGDIGVDDTPVPTWGRRRNRRGKALDPHADWYTKGDKSQVWALALCLAFTGHGNPADAGRYPLLCLGMQVHVANKGGDRAAVYILRSIDQRFTFRLGFLAGDRYYSDRMPEKFQNEVWASGRKLIFDYEKGALGPRERGPNGVQWAAGTGFCPATPPHLLNANKGLAKGSSDAEKAEAQRLMDVASTFALVIKEYPKVPGGPYRHQCPARGTSPSVTCPRAEACESDAERKRRGPVPVTVDLSNRRERASARAGRPRVAPADTPKDSWPNICTQSSVTTHQDEHAKHRQALPHGSTPWVVTYHMIRAHNEGGNGVLKTTDVNIGAGDRRKPRGTVAQILLISIQIAVANLQRIDHWLQRQRERRPASYVPIDAPETGEAAPSGSSQAQIGGSSTKPRPHDRR